MNKELQIIKKRLVHLLFSDYYTQNAQPLPEDMLLEGNAPGELYFSDIDYADAPAVLWTAGRHINRILDALYAGGEEKLRQDEHWRKKLLSLLRYWLSNDFCSTGWFHNQIGMPLRIANLTLMMEPWLPDDLKEKLVKRIARGSLNETPAEERTYVTRQRPADWTGANLMWGASITIQHALLTEDPQLLLRAVQRIGTALKYDKEGIQPDGGFQQHGPRWYSGGYGRGFVHTIAPLIYCLQGTKYAICDDQLQVLLRHVLDGLRFMQHNGYFDYGAVGRELTRPGNIHTGTLSKAVQLLAQSQDIPRKAELQAFAAELHSGKSDIVNTKFFESICLLQHSSHGRYISVRGNRPDIYGAEKTNGEGVLCYNMTYGTNTCFMHSGKEYFNLSPVWDYSKIPGTTARQETDEQLLQHGDWDILFRKESKCNCLVQNDRGILTQFSAHDGFSLRISYFVFDGCLAALGTDIQDNTPDAGALVTTIEQSAEDCCRFISDTEVVNSGWRYRNLDERASMTAQILNQSGSWRRNNPGQPETVVTKRLFTLTIPVTPEYDRYAYAVMPENAPADIKVLRNDESCQAILVNDNCIMAAFHDDVSIDVAGAKLAGAANDLLILDLTSERR